MGKTNTEFKFKALLKYWLFIATLTLWYGP